MIDEEREVLKTTYPSNSKTQKLEKIKPKEEKIVTGGVKKQKASFGKRLSELFLEDDSKSVGSYIIHDVLIPAAKAMLSDMVGGGLDMMLFGERRRGSYGGTSLRRDGNRSVVNYNSISQGDRYARDKAPVRQTRTRRDYEEIVLTNRGDAEDVVDRMIDILAEYNMVSVGDLYEMVGIEGNFTDQKYGWTDLRNATITRGRDGYLINLPRPQPLD